MATTPKPDNPTLEPAQLTVTDQGRVTVAAGFVAAMGQLAGI